MSRIGSFLNLAWREFVYGGHLISLGASSVIFTSAILLDIPVTWDFLLVVYLIFYVIYFYNRFKEFENDFLTNPDRTQHLEGYIRYTPFIIFCSILVITGILACLGNYLSMVFGLLLILSGIAYSLFFKKCTQKIIGFKSFYVSFVWALLVVFLAVRYSYSLNLSVFLIFTFIFLRCMVGVSFSDIKDIEEDKKEGLLTLAVVYGKRKSLKLLNIISALSIVPIIVGVSLGLFFSFSLVLVLAFFYSYFYFMALDNKKIGSSALYSTVVDAEHIPWSISILLSKFLLC